MPQLWPNRPAVEAHRTIWLASPPGRTPCTEYVDSLVLGLMLLPHERAREAGKALSSAGAGDTVRRVIVLVNFDKLFSME